MQALTDRQQRFIDYYIQYGNAAKAAQEAGYSARYANRVGSRLLGTPHIKAALADRMSGMAKDRIASAQEVLEWLTSVMRGEELGVDHANAWPSRIKAAELLGKRYGLYTDKVAVEGAEKPFEVQIRVVD